MSKKKTQTGKPHKVEISHRLVGQVTDSKKAASMRKTGIPVVGDVPWGTHFCQFYQSKEDLLDILIPYFKAGLENNEFCMWVTSEPLRADEAKKALSKVVPSLEDYIRSGQIEIISHTKWYLKGGTFDSKRVLNGWVEKLIKALDTGFDGLRLTGNTFWLEKELFKDFAAYEEEVNNVIGNYKIIAICSYSVNMCGAMEVVDVVNTHQFALIRHKGEWELIESSELKKTKESLKIEIARHEKTEKALRRSEAKYQSLFNNLMDGFALHRIVLDRKGKPVDYIFLEINEAFEKLTGLKSKNIINKRVTQVLPGIEKDPADWIGRYGKVALTGKPIRFEQFSQPLGKWYGVSSYSPQKEHFVAVFEDITERKKIEQKLEHLASYPELNPNAIFETRFDGKVTYLNPAARKNFYNIEKKEKKHPILVGFDNLHKTLKKKKNKLVVRDVEYNNKIYEQSVYYVPAEGIIRFYHLDITERMQAQEALRSSLEEVHQRSSETVALLKSANAVLKYRDFNISAKIIFDSCKELIGARAGYVALLNEEGNYNELLFLDSGGLPCTVDPSLPMPIRGLRAEAYKTKKAVYENNFFKSKWRKFMPKGHAELLNVLFAPLVIEDKAVGLLGIANKPGGFNNHDAKMATAFASIAAVALQNSRLLKSLEDSQKELGDEAKVSERLAAEMKKDRDTMEVIMENTNAHIAYLDTSMNFLMVNSTYAKGSGHTKDELIGKNHFDLFPNEENERIFRKVRDTGKPIEYKAKPFEFADQPWRGVTYWDWTLTPIKNGKGKVQGLVLSLVDVTESMKEKQFSDALNKINSVINSTLNFNEIMESVIVEAAKALGVEAAVAELLQDDSWSIRFVYRLPKEIIGKRFAGEEASISEIAGKERQPVVINDVSKDHRFKDSFLLKFGMQSFLAIPLVIRDELIGNLIFFYRSAPVSFTEGQVEFAKKLSSAVSLAVENARLYEGEHRIAETLQRSLLPAEVPKVKGLQVKLYYQSATEYAEVSGDFYDIFETPAGVYGIAMGDVAGKGVDAAAETARVKYLLRDRAYTSDLPSKVLADVNEALFKQKTEVFTTLTYCTYNPETAVLKISNAANPYPYLASKNRFLKITEVPVSLQSGIDYPSMDLKLGKGDLIIMYTDGLVEARHKGRLFGEHRVRSFVRNNKSLSLDKLLRGLVNEASIFSNGNLTDDILIIGIRKL